MSDIPPPPPPPPPPGNLTPPPGYVAYGGPGTMGNNVQKIGGIAKALGTLMMVQIPMSVLSALLGWQLAGKAADFAAGAISEDEFTSASRNLLTTLTSLLFLPIAILTIIWMQRMAANVKAIGRPGLRWSPNWAIFGWFVPPCIIYAIPWLMFSELWRASDPDVPANDPSWKQRPISPLVHAWWVLYGLMPLLGFVSAAGVLSQIGTNDMVDYAEQLDTYKWMNLGLGLVSACAAVVYLMLVRQLSARHMATTNEA